MYEGFYGLTADPFRLLPDPDVCFPHQSCAKAWAYLRYAVKRGEGIVVVTGPPGTGKTTLGERLINELDPTRIVSVRLVARDLNATELLRRLAYAFGMAAEHMDRAMLTYQIEHYLAELERKDGSTVVLVIDEAQTLSGQALEALRVLTDLQSPRSRPLLQLFLLGQDELEEIIGAPDMEQFRQRVIASCRLHTMDLAETKAYLEYRLQRVDWRGDPAIDGAAVYAVFRHSGGLPRHINKICSRLLLYGCAEEKHRLDESDVLAVVRDLTDELLTPAQAAPEAQPGAAPPPFTSLEALALVAAEDAATASPAACAAQTLRLSEPSEEAHLSEDPATQAAARVDGQGDRDAASRRRPVRRHGGHLLRSLRRRLRPLPDHCRQLGRRAGAWILGAASRTGARARPLASQLAAALTGAGPWLSRQAKRLGALWGNFASQERPILLAIPVVGLIAVGLVSWGARDGEQHAADALVGMARPTLPTAVSRAMQEARTTVLGRIRASVQAPATAPTDTRLERLMAAGLAASPDLPVAAPRDPEATTTPPLVTGPATMRAWLIGALGNDSSQWLASLPASNPSPPSDDAPTGSEDHHPAQEAPATAQAADETDPAQLSASLSGPAADAQPAAATPPLPASIALTSGGEEDFTGLLPPTGAGHPSPPPTLEKPEPAVTFAPSIQIGSATTADSGRPPADPGAGDPVQTRIERLLRLADTAIERNRLLIPEATSAYHYLQQVLAIDPDNAQARAGLERVVRRYNAKARKALDAGNYRTARRFVSRALRIDRHNARARALRAKIDTAEAREKKEREEALAALEAARKAELERMAAETKAAEPVAAKAPPRDSTSGFERIMKLLDGV